MSLTTDPNHPDLKRGNDETPVPQQDVYLVLSPEEIAKGYLQPLRQIYRHKTCGRTTTMGHQLSATYARDPWFYGGTYCCTCHMHRPVAEFTWEPDGQSMDPRKWTPTEVEQVMARKATLAVTPDREFGSRSE